LNLILQFLYIGTLFIKQKVEFDSQRPSILVVIEASDSGTPSLSTLSTVQVHVSDVNDNAPEWTMVPFPFLSVVSASAPPNSLVYKLQARDGDEGVNGEVEYFMSDGK